MRLFGANKIVPFYREKITIRLFDRGHFPKYTSLQEVKDDHEVKPERNPKFQGSIRGLKGLPVTRKTDSNAFSFEQ